MVPVRARVRRRLVAEYGAAGNELADRLERVIAAAPMAERQDQERLQAAVVLAAGGSLEEFETQLDLAMLDWRDLLMNSGLQHMTYPAVLDAQFGPA